MKKVRISKILARLRALSIFVLLLALLSSCGPSGNGKEKGERDRYDSTARNQTEDGTANDSSDAIRDSTGQGSTNGARDTTSRSNTK